MHRLLVLLFATILHWQSLAIKMLQNTAAASSMQSYQFSNSLSPAFIQPLNFLAFRLKYNFRLKTIQRWRRRKKRYTFQMLQTSNKWQIDHSLTYSPMVECVWQLLNSSFLSFCHSNLSHYLTQPGFQWRKIASDFLLHKIKRRH